MDVTPSKKAFEAISKFVDAVCGEDPSKLDHGAAAQDIRAKRAMAFGFLHQFHALAMREGVIRAVKEAQGRRNGEFNKAVDKELKNRGIKNGVSH